MKNAWLFVLASLLILSCAEKRHSSQFFMPAEWEPHDAVWLGWESRQHPYYHGTISKLIKELLPRVPLKIAVDNDSLKRVAKAVLHSHGIDTSRISFYTMKGDRYWIRDHGATFLVNDNGELGVADFDWNFYGYPGWLQRSYDQEDSVKKHLADFYVEGAESVDSLMAISEQATVLKTKVVHEGGATEVNGKGTLILCEATVLQRNPDWTKPDLESEFKRVLGVSKIIWLKKGLADDPHITERITGNYFGVGTGGHTDEFVRFADANTILLAWVDESEKDAHPINAINYERMSENLKILEQATDQDGKPFRIVKFPLPDPIYRPIVITASDNPADTLSMTPEWFLRQEVPAVGDTIVRVAAASYLNYLVTNGLVVMPSYTAAGSSKEKEEQAKKIFQESFPGRTVVALPFMPQNWNGGGIHCSTQQQPSRRK